LSLVSAAIVTPLGIVSVLVTAILSSTFLGEVISTRQIKGYSLICVGVLINLFAAPTGNSMVLASLSSPVFIFGISLHFKLLFVLLYTLLYKKREKLQYFVYIQVCPRPYPFKALFGSLTVITSKVLAVMLRLSSTTDSSTSTEIDTPYYTMILLVGVIFGAVSGEYFKQQALGKYPISRVGPLAYSSYCSLSVLR
jgi:drug/metabolite transporter (DMT)-like permease